MSADSDAMKAILSSYIAELTQEAAYRATNGPRPSYSLDGQSMDWPAWRREMMQRIKEARELIQPLEGPWTVISKARA